MSLGDLDLWLTRDANLLDAGHEAALDKTIEVGCAVPEVGDPIAMAGIRANAEVAGTVVMWEWIGDEGATTFSY